jgi:hypothetical protein
MSFAQSPRGCSIRQKNACLTLQHLALRELTAVYHALTLNVDLIDCSFCGAMRLASDCSCLSLAMRLSRFLCANPAYPHPLDLPGRPHGRRNAQIAPLGSCPWCQISRQANPPVTRPTTPLDRGRASVPPILLTAPRTGGGGGGGRHAAH